MFYVSQCSALQAHNCVIFILQVQKCVPSESMELCAFRRHGMRALYCLCSSHECTLHATAKLQHSTHYTCLIKVFRFGGIILSIAGMGQAFFMPSSIMPPLTLPSRQTHLGHGDTVHSLTHIGLSVPGPLNGLIPASWLKNWCLYIIICCAVLPLIIGTETNTVSM